MMRYKDDGTNDRQAPTVHKPPATKLACVFDTALAENERLRAALNTIYSEATIANQSYYLRQEGY